MDVGKALWKARSKWQGTPHKWVQHATEHPTSRSCPSDRTPWPERSFISKWGTACHAWAMHSLGGAAGLEGTSGDPTFGVNLRVKRNLALGTKNRSNCIQGRSPPWGPHNHQPQNKISFKPTHPCLVSACLTLRSLECKPSQIQFQKCRHSECHSKLGAQ